MNEKPDTIYVIIYHRCDRGLLVAMGIKGRHVGVEHNPAKWPFKVPTKVLIDLTTLGG